MSIITITDKWKHWSLNWSWTTYPFTRKKILNVLHLVQTIFVDNNPNLPTINKHVTNQLNSATIDPYKSTQVKVKVLSNKLGYLVKFCGWWMWTKTQRCIEFFMNFRSTTSNMTSIEFSLHVTVNSLTLFGRLFTPPLKKLLLKQ